MKVFSMLLLFVYILGNDQTPVENFNLTNVVNGATVSLAGIPAASGVVIIFTSNNCPFDRYYTDRLKNLANDYQGKIGFLLINSHLGPDETSDQMKTAYTAWGLSVPYLADKEQVAMKLLGATRSPEAYLLKKVNGKYFVSYSGALDDNAQAPEAVTTTYLKKAIESVLAGQPVEEPSTRAVGCTIKKK